MRGEELLDVLEHIDPVLIEEADRKPKFPWLRWTAVAACLALVIGICALWRNTNPGIAQRKYKRISFKSDTMSEEFDYLHDDTVVINSAEKNISTQVPIYEIAERVISDNERQLLMACLGLPTNPYMFKHEGNRIVISLVGVTDSSRGYFDMTEEEAVEEAWKLFRRIPFIDGEYECIGIRESYTRSDRDGKHILRAGVTFCRLLDGIRVTGNDLCTLTFDGSGLVGVSITLFDYKKVGTMDLVPIEAAEVKLKAPDDFDIGTLDNQPYKKVEAMEVNRVVLRMVNQYSRGCSILQPIYFYSGVATLEDGTQEEFTSKVIAIPEEMTYEE